MSPFTVINWEHFWPFFACVSCEKYADILCPEKSMKFPFRKDPWPAGFEPTALSLVLLKNYLGCLITLYMNQTLKIVSTPYENRYSLIKSIPPDLYGIQNCELLPKPIPTNERCMFACVLERVINQKPVWPDLVRAAAWNGPLSKSFRILLAVNY